MKETRKKEYLRKTRKLLQTKLYSRNVIQETNTGAVPCKILETIVKVNE